MSIVKPNLSPVVLALFAALHATTAQALSEVICTGDCDYDGAARVEELMTGVNIVLDRAQLSNCAGFDLNGDGLVKIDELLGGVHHALDGCPSARFEATACDSALVPEGQEAARMRCGFAIVPEHRGRSNGSTVRLAVAVLRATGPAPAADPIIHLGPGLGPILDGLMQAFSADFAAPLQHDRDLVFFDMRGTGRSTPSLACPELPTTTDAYGIEQSIESDTARHIEDLRACHDRLVAAGVDIAGYTTAEIAADARDILHALGYSQWNLYGWSQSTRIAQVLMRDSPAGEIRSAVLDSPIPLARPHIAEYAAHLERTLRQIAADCAADAACAHAFSDLEQTIFALFPALNAAPIAIEPIDPTTGLPFRVVITGDRLANFLNLILQDTTLITVAPLFAQQLTARNVGFLTSGFSAFAGITLGDALGQSVLCQDQVPLMTPEVLSAAELGVDPTIAHALRAGVVEEYRGACDEWSGVTPIAAPPPPLTSDIPTLLLSGEYDPATPPDYAYELAATLSHRTVIEFRGHGHGELYVADGPPGQPGCAMLVTAQHYNDPQHPVDASCAAALPPPHFLGS